MRLAIVDDEKCWREEIQKQMDRIAPDSCKARSELVHCSNGKDFWESYEKCPFDLIFLDMFLGEESGLDVAARIREKDREAAIVMISSENVYARECHNLEVDAYLLKPLEAGKLEAALIGIRKKKRRIWEIVKLPDGHRICMMDVKAVEYQQGNAHFSLLHRQEYELPMKRSELRDLFLDQFESFVPASRNCIVNLKYIKKVEPERLELLEDQQLPIPKYNYNKLKSARLEYWLEKGAS